MGRNGAGVKEASATSYEIAFTYRGVKCRERIKLKPSAANRKRLENHLGAIRDAIDKGTFDYSITFPDSPRRLLFIDRQSEALLLEEYIEDWLEGQAKRLKASTYTSYTNILNNIILPKFPGIILSEFKRAEFKKFLITLKCGNKRLSNIQSALRSALQDAVDDEILEVNPLYGWKYKNKEVIKAEDDVDPFSADEQEAILKQLIPAMRNMIQFCFWTGVRPSELVALDWADVDWLRGTVRVNKALTQESDENEEPKTKAGNRDIKLLQPALEALMAQKEHTLLKGQEIFQNPRTGERWEGPAPIRKTLWIPALKKAKVRYRRPYQTRHTFASMMLSSDEPIGWVAQMMGHSDWGMIRKVYARFIKDSVPEAGNKAVEMFSKKAVQNAAIPTPNNPKKLPN